MSCKVCEEATSDGASTSYIRSINFGSSRGPSGGYLRGVAPMKQVCERTTRFIYSVALCSSNSSSGNSGVIYLYLIKKGRFCQPAPILPCQNRAFDLVLVWYGLSRVLIGWEPGQISAQFRGTADNSFLTEKNCKI